MSNAKITPSFHYQIAKSVYDDIATNTGHYHYFVSNTEPWTDIDNVPEYSITNKEEYNIRSNIILTKRIDIGNIAYVIKDRQYTGNTVYTMYDDIVEISGKNFYVVVNDNIYKCIYNNNNGISTISPSGTESFNQELSDGYIWKYMATIPLGFSNKFSGSGMVPITRKIYNPRYASGNITPSDISIISNGTAYDAQSYAVITGDGIDGEVEFGLDSNGAVTSITLINQGSGYTYANLDIVHGAGDPGSGAEFKISIGNYGNLDTNQASVEAAAVDGSLSSIIIENGGSGYNTPSNVRATIEGDGTNAEIQLTIVDGVITDALIPFANYGSGYTNAICTITDSSMISGGGAIIRVILSPIGGHGYDIPRELFASNLCLFTALDDDENHGIPVDNSYNQTGLIKDMNKFELDSWYTEEFGSTCYLISASSINSSVINNTYIYSSSGKYRVISLSGTSILLQPYGHNVSPSVSTYYSDVNLNNILFILDSITATPTINKYSGDILLAENRMTFPINSNPDIGNQGVKFKTFISF